MKNDLITLTGMNKISTWRFPNTTNCPLFRCEFKSKSRSQAIKHYRSNHASTSVLCFLCKKPISVKNNTTNYRTHFKNIHPHVKFSLSQPVKIESSTPNNQKVTLPIHKYFAKEDKKRCKICGLKCTNLSRHIREMHTKKLILCPLKICDFTSKRLESIRAHWKRRHGNFRFPEIDPQSGFTYRTTTADSEENVNLFDSCYF